VEAVITWLTGEMRKRNFEEKESLGWDVERPRPGKGL
jgi:hypothetical protein